MCGIFGILGREPVADKIIASLRRLEYRGYDSAGLATLESGRLTLRRAQGKLRPTTLQETERHLNVNLRALHAIRIDRLDLPWGLIAAAGLLAVVGACAAAWWPARAIARLPVVLTLSGRPPRPRQGSSWRSSTRPCRSLPCSFIRNR